MRGVPSGKYGPQIVQPQNGAFPNSLFDLPVHVGLPVLTTAKPLLTYDLHTFQHLDFILGMYELKISALHRSSRRAESIVVGFDIVSNPDSFSKPTVSKSPKPCAVKNGPHRQFHPSRS